MKQFGRFSIEDIDPNLFTKTNYDLYRTFILKNVYRDSFFVLYSVMEELKENESN